MQIRKKEVLLFSYDMVEYIRDPKTFTGELLHLINTFCLVAGYKINSSVFFLYTNHKQTEKDIMVRPFS